MSIHHSSPFVTTLVLFLLVFFEFSENKRLFVPHCGIGRFRMGFSAPPSMVYCVYQCARYGANERKQPAETANLRGIFPLCRGFLRLETAFAPHTTKKSKGSYASVRHLHTWQTD
jgi:hypothetical protein